MMLIIRIINTPSLNQLLKWWKGYFWHI